MKTNERVVSILNDLIRTNLDRIKGYQKAAEEIKDTTDFEIKTIFIQMAEDSRNYKSALTDAVIRLGGEPAKDTSAAGDIYRAWMDVKSTFSSDDVLAALQLCEFGEDRALESYKDALSENFEWPVGVKNIVENQRKSIKASHDTIKTYRDQYAHAH
ncbi:ferritin-like domain-containing protein [Ohtaekwangia koreensis]|jgi:uncharacterized protein (TIGR02284 family)|uniref:DUF2383 domain-containing protein n=1 Tax=Ohtaekwangia koreensis TaxID=688867 RepID=A0A1T5IPL4_9BACT|nr:PA2169 family four-helix-bundle protein [Ohtaekwangia koreensis]SKC41119.1 conserved hypothetical protein [Ohtaekwangia koreensis]